VIATGIAICAIPSSAGSRAAHMALVNPLSSFPPATRTGRIIGTGPITATTTTFVVIIRVIGTVGNRGVAKIRLLVAATPTGNVSAVGVGITHGHDCR